MSKSDALSLYGHEVVNKAQEMLVLDNPNVRYLCIRKTNRATKGRIYAYIT